MAFPLSPANNQTALVNGIVYQWNAALGVWKRNGSINSASIGQLVLTSTQSSTSNGSGTLIVAGGAGITGNLYTGGIYITGVNGITFPDGTSQTSAASPTDSYARTTANTATNNITIIQGVDTAQNTRMSIIEGVDTTQNTNITIATNAATGAFAQANATAGGLTTANSRIDVVEGVNTSQNTRMGIIEGVDATQNTNITIADTKAQAAFDKANAANSLAQAAYNQANTGGGTLDQFARDTANSASANTIIIQGVDVTQNTRLSSIETININQNTNIQTAFDKANTAPKTTTSTTAPSSPNAGDMWYDTDYDVLLRYTYDGTANNWIDITGPIIRSTYIRPTYLISANVS